MRIWKLIPADTADPRWHQWNPTPILVRARDAKEARRLAAAFADRRAREHNQPRRNLGRCMSTRGGRTRTERHPARRIVRISPMARQRCSTDRTTQPVTLAWVAHFFVVSS